MSQYYSKCTHKADILSGFIISLIALPLSMAIAIAAGAPASAGILSAIIGGIIGTLISGTHVAINGPAAGMIVVVASSIYSLGGEDLLLGFKRTLAATIAAGALQIIIGILRCGKVAFLCPVAVVRGMLSALGIIIILKQIPILFGSLHTANSLLGLLQELPLYISLQELPIVVFAALSVGILLFWQLMPKLVANVIPAPLLVIVLGVICGYYFDFDNPHDIYFLNDSYHIGPEFLVSIPSTVRSLIILPEFDIFWSHKSLLSVITIFAVGSLESLLSAYAVDKLDPMLRKSNLNKEIISKGVCNICCGLLGAYPIITEIVRSSANITNGAKTMWSNFYHGVFILLFLLLLPELINHIPLVSLAAILIIVGIKLIKPSFFFSLWQNNKRDGLVFLTTLSLTVLVDLLTGIFVGIVMNIIFNLFSGITFKQLLSPKIYVRELGHRVELKANSNISFLSYFRIKQIITYYKKPILFNSNGYYIDLSINDLIDENINQSKG